MPHNLVKHLYQDDNGNYCARYQTLELRSVFQPIFDFDNHIIGCEALVRIQDEKQQVVEPGLYFSDRNPDRQEKLTLDLICRLLHLYNFAHSQYRSGKLFLNLHPNTLNYLLHETDINITSALPLLQQFDLTADQLVLEVLEARCDNLDKLKQTMQLIDQSGIHVAIDDFGSGDSNLKRVQIVGPKIVKMDHQLLVRFMQGSTAGLVEAMQIAKAFGAHTLIEGIETQQQLDVMRSLKIDFYQGYFLATPQPMQSNTKV